MSFLARIRSQSPEARARYALVVAAVVTGVIGLVWVTTLPAQFSGVVDRTKKAAPSFSEIIADTTTQVANTFESTQVKAPPSPTPHLEALGATGSAQSDGEVSGDASADTEAPAAPAEPAEATPEAAAGAGTTPEPQPRVILIGTSTPKTSE